MHLMSAVRGGCLLVLMFLAGGLAVRAEEPAFAGFRLDRYAAPGWHWEPARVQPPQVARLDSSGAMPTLVFQIPLAALSPATGHALRVGIVSGQPGAEPRTWIAEGRPYKLDSTTISPWATNLLGETVLYHAELLRANDALEIKLTFAQQPRLHSAWDLYLFIDADGDPTTGFKGAELLLQNPSLKSDTQGPLSIDWFEMQPGIVTPGETARVTLAISNNAETTLAAVTASLALDQNVTVLNNAPTSVALSLRPGEVRRVHWDLQAGSAGFFVTRAVARAPGVETTQSRWLSVVAAHDPRREYRSATGDWLPYPQRPTLQNDNANPLLPLPLKTSREAHNRFGITAHLPRTQDDEEPFVAQHLIDGDPQTVWGSRWWRVGVPFDPEWVQVDLPRARRLGEVRFLPGWQNGGMPAGLLVQVSADGQQWTTITDQPRFKPVAAPEGSPLRVDVRTWQVIPVADLPARSIRFTATRLNAGHTGFYAAPFDPHQFRLAEVQLRTPAGLPIDLHTATASASTVHHAWYNTAATVTETWPRLFESGVKYNRIGQWGDKTDWAAVEKTKGVYTLDPEIDKAVNACRANGVEILMTLAYGNNLYQRVPDPPDPGPAWERGHPFSQCAPTTPEAIEGYANYCAFMARHFKGRIREYEIWNEENGGWFIDVWADNLKGRVAGDYGRALAAAVRAIKREDPEAHVSFGGISGASSQFIQLALDQGGVKDIDAVGCHPYGRVTPEAASPAWTALVDGRFQAVTRPAGVNDYGHELQSYVNLLRGYRPGFQMKDVWANEINWMAPGQPAMTSLSDNSELVQAKYLARLFALHDWYGSPVIWWSLLNANHIQEWAILRSSDLSPRAAYYAAQYASAAFDNTHGVSDIALESTVRGASDVMIRTWRDAEGRILVGLWRTSQPADNVQPSVVDLRVPFSGTPVVQLIDVLYGNVQHAKWTLNGDHVEIKGLLVGDWPLLVRFDSDIR